MDNTLRMRRSRRRKRKSKSRRNSLAIHKQRRASKEKNFKMSTKTVVSSDDEDWTHSFEILFEEAKGFLSGVWHKHFDHLPEWMQDNEFLRKFHRPELSSFKECFKSVFALHTETGNIWTHMLGAILFIIIMIHFVLDPPEGWPIADRLLFVVFFLCAVACMGLSFVYHTVGCHSHKVCLFWSKMDYAGIALMIVGSCLPMLHYGFYNMFITKVTYMSLFAFFGVLTLIVALSDRFGTPEYRPYRAIVFSSLGLFGAVPMAHYVIFVDGVTEPFVKGGLGWVIAMAVFYLVGATLYAFRFPESCWPGKFDLYLQSHQIFHTCVLIAALLHYRGLRQMAFWRLGGTCATGIISDFLNVWASGTPSHIEL